jgi:NAD(P)-dependent dehydrogenase (short-subunit alcohol dehydrogenase family)
MATAVFISGASSGIGDALARTVPLDDARVIGIARRPGPVGEHLAADLSDPAAWRAVAERFDSELGGGDVGHAVFLHIAGYGAPFGPAVAAPLDEYIDAVLLNSGAGQVLGKAFVEACRKHGVPGTLLLCSSPAAIEPMPAMSHYGSGKAAFEFWVQCIAQEQDDVRVLAVRPYAVDTPLLRAAIDDVRDEEEVTEPVVAAIREAAAKGELASPEKTAAEIWQLVTGQAPSGSIRPVGAVPEHARR